MYLPSHFESRDEAALAALMSAHPLAQIVHVNAEGGLDADAVPLLWDAERRTLRGHVARANPLWRAADGKPVLAVFSGPDAYVSPNWYPSKAGNHRAVPTWNYAVVHAHGVPRIVDDAPGLLAIVGSLTDTHEAARAAPWKVSDAPDDYVAQMLRAIVGIEIPVQRWVGKFKLSQNHAEPNRTGVLQGLREHDAQHPLAALMQEHAPR